MNQVINMAQAHGQRRGRGVRIHSAKPVDSAEERVRRLYAEQAGPLIAWLFDEARRRGHLHCEMARELGVTYGYVNQLRSGIRSTANITPTFSQAVARYLGVPEVVVLIVCGRLGLASFVQPPLTEASAIDRALARMMDDQHLRSVVPVDVMQLPPQAKKALVMLYAESANADLFGMQPLPQVVQFLQRAAELHDFNAREALAGRGEAAVDDVSQQG